MIITGEETRKTIVTVFVPRAIESKKLVSNWMKRDEEEFCSFGYDKSTCSSK